MRGERGRSAVSTATGVPPGTTLLGWLLRNIPLTSAPGTYTRSRQSSRPQMGSLGRRPPERSGSPHGDRRSAKARDRTPRVSRTELRPSHLLLVAVLTSNGARSHCSGRFRLDRCVFRMARTRSGTRRHPASRGSEAYVAPSRSTTRDMRGPRCSVRFTFALHSFVVGTFRAARQRIEEIRSPRGAVIEESTATKQAPVAANEWQRAGCDLVRRRRRDARSAAGALVAGYSVGKLLPGATKSDPLGWTQPVSWVATYECEPLTPIRPAPRSSAPRFRAASARERSSVGAPASGPLLNAKDYPRIRHPLGRAPIAVGDLPQLLRGRWRWYAATSRHQDDEQLWQDVGRLYGNHDYLQNLTVRADGTAASTALKGRGTPTGCYTRGTRR